MGKLLYTGSILLLGLAAIFLQGAVLKPLLPDFLVPNLILAIVVFLAFYDSTSFGAILVFLLGLLYDLYGINPLLVGPSAGSLVLVYGVLASLSQRIFVESGLAVFFMATLSAVLHVMLYSVLIYEFNSTTAEYFSLSLANALATGAVTPFAFRLLSVLFKSKSAFSVKGHSIGPRSRTNA